MNYEILQEKLGFTAKDKAEWLEINAKYYEDPEQGWRDKLMMHAYPKRSAAVYVMPSYQSPITGQWIDTPSQRREDMARNNCRPWEGLEAEKQEAAKRGADEEAKADAKLESAISQTLADMPREKKEILGVL